VNNREKCPNPFVSRYCIVSSFALPIRNTRSISTRQNEGDRADMNGWNRLFVIVAVVWALVAPFLLVAENNKPAERMFSSCSDVAYQLYGSSSSSKPDWDRYRAEEAKCSATLVRGLVGLPETFGAMFGAGDWKLGGVAWGFILIPLALLWIVAWGVGRVVHWVAAGFRR
jgi:hypothetical protein